MDYHATTPLDPRVLAAVTACLSETYGNASSKHHPYGWEAEALVKKARAEAAKLIGAQPDEILFTSGSTESNNTAIKGIFEIYREKGSHIITQATEHKSVLDVCKFLEARGARVTYLKVDSGGRIRLEELKKTLTPETILISVMFANNEAGTIQPVREIGALAKERGVFFHVDAAQAAGKIPIDVNEIGVDLLSWSAHKMYGPKGIGALYVRKRRPRVRMAPLLHGGGQENNLRSGTLNVPGIVGLGKACEIARKEMAQDAERIGKLRDRLHAELKEALEDVYLNGDPERRLYNNLNLSFGGVDSESLLMALNEHVAVSTGAACAGGSTEPSYVLKALGIPEERIQSSLRFGLGKFTTEEEMTQTVRHVVQTVKRLRQISPLKR